MKKKARATIKRKNKEFHYLVNSGLDDIDYLTHAVDLFSGTCTDMDDAEETVLIAFQKRRMYPLKKGDSLIISDKEGTREYNFKG